MCVCMGVGVCICVCVKSMIRIIIQNADITWLSASSLPSQ